MSHPAARLLITGSVVTSVLALILVGVRITPVVRAADPMASTVPSSVPTPTGMVSPSVAGGITIEGAWARVTLDIAVPAAAYLTLTNHTRTDDALVGVTSPAAATVETHETTVGDSGMMGMQHVDRIPVPAASSVALRPGSYHLMLMGLVAPLVEGSAIELTLTFEHAPGVTISVPVASGPGVPMPSMGLPMPSMTAPGTMAPVPSA